MNLRHPRPFHLVDEVIIDFRLLGTCSCSRQVSELNQMSGTAQSLLGAACHSAAAGKQKAHVSFLIKI